MILQGDCLEVLKTLETNSINCCITSPPYWGLRDYGVEGQLGLEKTPEEYVANMVNVFSEVKRVLHEDGTLWLNLGDSYAGSGGTGEQFGQIKSGLDIVRPAKPSGILKPKDLVGIPWRTAFALQSDGWYLRQDIIWHKPNPMPESVTDRCTKAHEYIFLLSKNQKYYFDNKSIKEPLTNSSLSRLSQDIENQNGTTRANGGMKTNGNLKAVGDIELGRNKRSVWTVTTKPFKEAHFATFPEDLILPCVLAGCPKGGIILDPFNGAGTTGVVAKKNFREYIGIELNEEYIKITEKRIADTDVNLTMDFEDLD
jgi:DNA modification methylase